MNYQYDRLDIERAGLSLAEFFTAQAEATATDLGFTWRASMSAPTNLADLTTEFRSCQITGLGLRVSGLHCDDTIYPSAGANMAFRFVHDARHVWLQADFDLAGELEVARGHRRSLSAAGFDERSLQYQMLVADTAGQTLLFEQTGSFPANQKLFVHRCITSGIDAAIAAESRRHLRAA